MLNEETRCRFIQHGVNLGFCDGNNRAAAHATGEYLFFLNNDTLLPPDASWLNQAEPLLDAFELHYLKRGSWRNKEEFRQHVEAAWPEYNRRYAHPFDWKWTIPKMKQWFAKHSQ